MTRRFLPLLLVFSLFAAACSSEPEAVETTTTSTSTSTTTTTLPTTTTTVPSMEIKGAPHGLLATVQSFYDYATGESETRPKAPKAVLNAITPAAAEIPLTGKATRAEFKKHVVAVVEMRKDLFLVVHDGTDWTIVGGKWPSVDLPAYYGKAPRLVAVVGSDARPGQDVDRSRADSIHFVGLDGKGEGALVGLPRDSYVDVPGFWRQKITGSLSLGGPEAMMASFEELTGLEFQGYLITGFAGFEDLLTEVLGGVEVDVPFAINDRWAHVALSAGEQILDGAEALGFARARKTVPGGDFTRSSHQGVIMLAAARAVREMGMSAIPGLMNAAEPHLVTDLAPGELLTFSAMAVSAKLDEIDNVVAPGSPGTAGGASVVFLHSSADDLWADLADGKLDDAD